MLSAINSTFHSISELGRIFGNLFQTTGLHFSRNISSCCRLSGTTREARGSFTSIAMTGARRRFVFFLVLLLDDDGLERERDTVLAELRSLEKRDVARR